MLCFVFFFLCPTRAAFVRRPAGERTLAARGFRAFFIRFVSLYQGIDVDPLRSTAVARRATPSSLSYRLVASFQWTLPLSLPIGRDCKGNNFFPFHQITAAGFSAPGTAVPRLRLQRYYQRSLSAKFFHNFFQKNFTPLNQSPVTQTNTTQTFFAKKLPQNINTKHVRPF